VLHRIGIRRREAVADRPQKVAPDAADVGGEVREGEALGFAVAGDHVHLARHPTLQAPDLLGVEGELQDEVGLGVLGELGVVGLVRVSAEVGRLIAAQQEVREPDPAVGVRERRLVDDLGAVEHRLVRTPDLLGEVRAVDVHELAPVADQPLAERLLVAEAPLANQVRVGPWDLDELDAPGLALLLEPREVATGEEVVERRRRQAHSRRIDSPEAVLKVVVASASCLTPA
jgi:hypothetical protein